MAHRDRSAGHAFMYVNVKELLQQTQDIKKAAEASAPVRTTPATSHPFGTQIPTPLVSQSTEHIQNNLERLQALHHKLHAMLEELNKLTGKK